MNHSHIALFDVRHDDHDDHNEDDSHDSMVAKLVAMAVLFTASFTLGCLPIKLSTLLKWDQNPKSNIVVQVLLCMGGGVLLCTTFLHLLPEVAEHIEGLQASGQIAEMNLHLAEFLMCSGFFLMYFVEEVVHLYIHKRNRQSQSVNKSASTDSNLEAKTDFDHTHQDHHNSHSHIIVDDTPEDSIVKNLRGLLIVLALSVHELFEGLAVGLESSAATVWYMFGAVSAHKLVIAFCIGVELVTNKTRTLLIIIYVLTFAVVSPLGILIGMLVSEERESSTAVPSAILQGLASGTLLYVVFFEILQKDRRDGGIIQYFAVLVGFLIMFAITMLSIGSGILLSASGDTLGVEGGGAGGRPDVVSVALQGMAAGTLLYVVFFEVLARERSNRDGAAHAAGIWQLLAIIAGFAVMFCLQMLSGHEHHHGEHEHGHEHEHKMFT